MKRKPSKNICKSTANISGNFIIVKDECKISLSQILKSKKIAELIPKMSKQRQYTGKQSLNPIIREKCKGTHGKERNLCVKDAKQSLKEKRHEKYISEFEVLEDKPPIPPKIEPYDKEWALRM